MAGMKDLDVEAADDSSLDGDAAAPSTDDRILQKLLEYGIPQEYLVNHQAGLVHFIKENKTLIPDIVCCIMEAGADVFEASGDNEAESGNVFTSSMLWLQWLMFESEPRAAVDKLIQKFGSQRAVCGAVWGQNDLAYRCRTCEYDPTCAICVACFQNGDHKDHDYSIMYTGGGCCDCGDVTAWKQEGFCSKHKGAEQIQPLPEDLMLSVGPVLDALARYWMEKVSLVTPPSHVKMNPSSLLIEFANKLTSAVVDMLSELSRSSESLLSFIAKNICNCAGLLDVLAGAERSLDKQVIKNLHQLLLKLIIEPLFKYEFAKAFIRYYSVVIRNVIHGSNDSLIEASPLVPMFSVQIFTVPPLAARLVREVNLLGVLLECSTDLFFSCAGEDGRLQANKWANLYDTSIRLIEDTRYVLTHNEVSTYVACERPDISKSWIKVLSFLQGMDPLKRVTGMHVEEENENLVAPFMLEHSLGVVNKNLVQGSFSAGVQQQLMDVTLCSTSLQTEDNDSQRNAKVGRLDNRTESGLPRTDVAVHVRDCNAIPSPAIWLIFECLRAIVDWLRPEIAPEASVFSPKTASSWRLSDGSILCFSPDHGSERQDMLNLTVWPQIIFDVSSQETSFHAPLHRLLALVLQIAMKYCYSVDEKIGKPSQLPSLSTTHNFFGQVLSGGCNLYSFASLVMEQPLRVRVVCAQLRAGMWRKNGDAPILSAEWYRSAQWVEQGFESDLFLLQCCAALAPPEKFVETILERFGLSSYMAFKPTEQHEHEPALLLEMLIFIIQIVQERRYCGLSTSDKLKREIIFKLATGDATHSQIVKSLPHDISKSNMLQTVLDMLAVYSNPSGLKQGKYSLRQNYWKDLDLYHPRWNSRDLQVAEERYCRFCKVSPLNDQLPRWTYIYDPLSDISNVATSKAVLRIIHSVLFYAIHDGSSSRPRAPESVLVTALHLLSLALDICEKKIQIHISQFGTELLNREELCVVQSSYIKECFPILVYSTEMFLVESKKESMLSLLVSLMHKYRNANDSSYSGTKFCNIYYLTESLLKKLSKLSKECADALSEMAPRIFSSVQSVHPANVSLSSDSMDKKAKARERQAAIMAKLKSEQSKFMENNKTLNTDQMDNHMLEPDNNGEPEESLSICSLCRESDSESQLCYLIFLQKSRLTTFVDRGNPSWEYGGQLEKPSNFAQTDHSSTVTANDLSSSVQSGQITNLDSLLNSEVTEVDAVPNFSNENYWRTPFPTLHGNIDAGSDDSLEKIENDIYNYVVRELTSSTSEIPVHENICSTSTSADSEKGRPRKHSILGAKISSLSRELSKRRPSRHVRMSSAEPKACLSAAETLQGRFGPEDCDGVHISSCGHVVHRDCHDRYLFSLKQRHVRRLGLEGGQIVDPDMGELLCPVCRRLANSILPISPNLSGRTSRAFMASADSLLICQPLPVSVTSTSSLHFSLALSLLERTGRFVAQAKLLKIFSRSLNDSTEPTLDPCIRRLIMLYYPHSQSTLLASDRLCKSLFLWDTLKYSLACVDIAARRRVVTKSIGLKASIESLHGELNSSNGFILSLLFGIANSTRTSNHLEALLRFKGIQLLAECICSGKSGNLDVLDGNKGRGAFASTVEDVSDGAIFPDFVFWKQCTRPILTQDPFSSLLWVIFCLPAPFLSSSDFFLAMVHLFYLVAVIQALIACYSEDSFDKSSFSDCLLHDVCNTISEVQLQQSQKIFVSNYISSSCHPKDMVRRLTLPYLRRCSLLWKLLSSSSYVPTYDNLNIWAKPDFCFSDEEFEGTTFLTTELREIGELEGLFHIGSLDMVLKDEAVLGLAFRWCRHFWDDLKMQKYSCKFYCTPAVPFRMMLLPPIYQILLERYVKMQCASCGEVPDEPALCLLCGKLCSPNWKPCCRASKCVNHAAECCAGVGVFLLIRKTTILLLRSARIAFWPSPYLDAFGEEDYDVQRGRPLYLNNERYAALTYLVTSHSFDRTSEVLRQTTIGLFGAD